MRKKTRPSASFALMLLQALAITAAAPLRLDAMDVARTETRVDEAVAQFGVEGHGVLVAILDRGIDWQNNDFRNPDGSTRIKYIFDLTDDTGQSASGNTFGKGTIYTEAQINAALNGSGPSLPTRDGGGHGTGTAGVAAGNGANNAKYRGVAPRASLIIVKVTADGAPAHDGQPAEAPFYDPARLPIAIDFVKAKKEELGLPCVMLLNLGSTGGPTDGTSELARKIDSTVGPGIPGLVFVTGPGDDGGVANRAGGTVPQNGSVTVQINKTQSGPMAFDLWYPEGDPADPAYDNLTVTIQTPSGTYGPFTAPTGANGFNDNSTAQFDYYHRGSNTDFAKAENGKRNIYILFKEGAGSYSVTLGGGDLRSGARRFDATLNPSNLHSPNVFTSFVVPGSIWDGATAHHNICPGDYVIRTQWTDIDGIARSNLGEGNPGEIWKGSSTGPTFDGRRGVDLAAPGDSVFTTYDPKSFRATFRFNLIADGGGLYGRFNAVSAAAPQVTGVIALVLQKNPQLDAIQVREILQNSARADNFTGNVPNETWGFGKMDAVAALERVASTLPAGQLLNISTRLRVGTGENALIGGFILTGNDPKSVIVRAIGPSLGGQGVAGALPDTTLELFNGAGEALAFNDDWKESQQSEIEATTIPPGNDVESAIVRTLTPGNYTAVVRGKNDTTGVGLVEVYDLSTNANARLANISSRGFVDAGENVMIGGFIVGGGSGGARVVVRAIGPSLGQQGVAGALQDPTLQLVDANGAEVRANDNWRDGQGAELESLQIQPNNDLEAAVLATLGEGNFTAVIRGKDGQTGVGLVEVYNVQ